MNSAFDKLPKGKREAIISICLEEFASNGYENTSTDVITARAGISKGILFHYFKSKKNLYFYIVDYAINTLTEKTLEEFYRIETRDFFEKMKQLSLTKQRLSMIYANETKLIRGLLATPPPSIRKEVEEIRIRAIKSSQDIQSDLMKNMIPPKLRKGVTLDKAMSVTQAVFGQLTNKYLSLFGSGEAEINEVIEIMIGELDEYIDILKHGIYEVEN